MSYWARKLLSQISSSSKLCWAKLEILINLFVLNRHKFLTDFLSWLPTVVKIYRFCPKNKSLFFIPIMWNMIQYTNKGNYFDWISKNKNFDSLLIESIIYFGWIGRQKYLIIFGQSLVISIVVTRATEELAHRTSPASRTLCYVCAGCSCLK